MAPYTWWSVGGVADAVFEPRDVEELKAFLRAGNARMPLTWLGLGSNVLIRDGGTSVIGGIFVVNEGRSEVGVPWFRKIPIFGWLFKNKGVFKRHDELLIFITPRIVKY